jgi:hypothetical protein
MKSLKSITGLISLVFLGFTVIAQDNKEEKLNLPGDNLNLYAVMDLFRESETFEVFEKNLNAEDSKINNLDLNADDKIDYIRVIDNVDGDVHTIVLQVAVNEKENQDVAVFTVMKDKNGQVQVQLIGDEELYGKDYIIEPNYDDITTASTPNPGYTGNNKTSKKETVVTKTTYVEVASWPVITYMYVPTYTVWHSPWYWGYYPSYWNPWKPYYWDYYYGYHYNYHNHYYGYYHHSHYYRYPHYNDHYYNGYRSHSNTVNQHRQSGMYKNTYSHPETRKQGSADFNKKYPDGYRPSARPGTSTNETRPSSKPSVRPTNGQPSKDPNVSQPSTRPTTRPTSNPGVNNPSARPATTSPSAKPVMPSSRPTPNPSSTKSDIKKEVHRNSSNIPTARPNVNKQASRPSTSSPSTKPANTRPASKPATTKSSSGTQNSNSNTRTERPK